MSRMVASLVRPWSVFCAALWIGSSLSLFSHAALGQEKQTEQAVRNEASGSLAAGAEVVLKSFRTPLDDDGKPVLSSGQETFWIERIEGERVRISLRDKSRRGWVRRDQVVPMDQAVDFFTAEIARNAKNTDALWSRAGLWIKRKDDDHALADYDQLIRLLPDYAAFHVDRGGILLRKRRLDQALADLNEANRLAPRDSSILVHRGILWSGKNEPDKAIADFSAAIKLNPKQVYAYFLRGKSWEEKRDRDQAIADYSQAIKLDPQKAHFRLIRGQAWSRRGMHAEAIADFDDVIRLTPSDATAFFARGNEWLKDALADRKAPVPDKAIADFSRAIELDPKYAAAYSARADAWRLKHDYARLAQDLQSVVSLSADDLRAHEALARLLATCKDARIRDGKRAVELATRACELSTWTRPDCVDALAAADAETGDFLNAIKWVTRAIELVKKRGSSLDEGNMKDHLRLYQNNQPCRE